MNTRSEVAPNRLVCMNVTGGIGHANQTLEATGLSVTVRARPHDRAESGGDVHYVSSCASGRITRVVLADVAGHGADAAARADDLRTAMQRSVNDIRHTGMVRRTNEAFVAAGIDDRFATAIFVTYFLPTRSLSIANAGHPAALRFDGASRRWGAIDDPQGNLPLGLGADQSFRDLATTLGAEDALLLVTDGVIESRNANDDLLGAKGLVDWLGTRPPSPALVTALYEHVLERSANVVDDDLTIVLLEPNDNRVSLANNLLALLRWIRGRVTHGTTGDATPDDVSWVT